MSLNGYTTVKILAAFFALAHLYLHFTSVTGFFNRICIGFSLIVLLLPRKWWGLYLLPVLIMTVAGITSLYLIWLRYAA